MPDFGGLEHTESKGIYHPGYFQYERTRYAFIHRVSLLATSSHMLTLELPWEIHPLTTVRARVARAKGPVYLRGLPVDRNAAAKLTGNLAIEFFEENSICLDFGTDRIASNWVRMEVRGGRPHRSGSSLGFGELNLEQPRTSTA
jgi:hypothetical protein